MTSIVKARSVLTCLVLFLLLGCQPSNISKNKTHKVSNKSPEMLKKVVLDFRKSLVSKDAKERMSALESAMPNKQDVAVLFPKNPEKAWELIEQENAKLKKEIDILSAEFQRGSAIIDVNVVNLRKKDDSGKYKDLFTKIPKNIPVYTLLFKVEKGGETGSPVYVFVNNKWIFIIDLDFIAMYVN